MDYLWCEQMKIHRLTVNNHSQYLFYKYQQHQTMQGIYNNEKLYFCLLSFHFKKPSSDKKYGESSVFHTSRQIRCCKKKFYFHYKYNAPWELDNDCLWGNVIYTCFLWTCIFEDFFYYKSQSPEAVYYFITFRVFRKIFLAKSNPGIT